MITITSGEESAMKVFNRIIMGVVIGVTATCSAVYENVAERVESTPPRVFSAAQHQVIDEYLSKNPYGLDENMKLDVRSYVRQSSFNPSFGADCFWEKVGGICDPLAKLTGFACGMIGGVSLSINNDHNEATKIGSMITTVLGGMTGLFVGVHAYANQEMDKHQKMILSLNEIYDLLESTGTGEVGQA